MSSPTDTFEARHGDRLLKLSFKEPLFSLFADFPALCRELYPRLQPFGLQVSGMRLESTGGDLGEVHLRCQIPGSVTIRVWVDRLEIGSDLLRFSPMSHAEITAHLLEGIASHHPSFQNFDGDLRVHGSLSTRTSNEFLEQWSGRAPENLGPRLGSGVVFYFGPQDHRAVSSVTLDNSELIQGGLFVRTRTVGDASVLSGHELGAITDSFFTSVLREIGLTMQERA